MRPGVVTSFHWMKIPKGQSTIKNSRQHNGQEKMDSRTTMTYKKGLQIHVPQG